VTPDQDTDNLVEPLFIDLTISKVDSPDPVKAGNELTYTLTVNNEGNKDATGVKVVDTLASGVSFVSASGDHGFTFISYDSGTRKVTLTGGAINAGSSATITIKVTFEAATSPQTKTNTAKVDPDNTIPESDNNNNETGDVKTTVNSADLDVTIQDDSPSGEDLKASGGYTSGIQYKLSNTDGDADIVTVTFSGTIDGTAARTGASVSFSGTGPTASWTCSGPLPAGKYIYVTILVTGPSTEAGKTVTYAVNAPTCTDPGPCTDNTVSPANSDHSDVTPNADTDTLTS
jgi:uncharacterized repeat protein (TIGR01451 family)